MFDHLDGASAKPVYQCVSSRELQRPKAQGTTGTLRFVVYVDVVPLCGFSASGFYQKCVATTEGAVGAPEITRTCRTI